MLLKRLLYRRHGMNRIRFGIAILISMLVCTSSFGRETMGTLQKERKNIETGEKIIKCINDKDVDGLYELFSIFAKTSQPNLKADIQKMYDRLGDTITEYKKDAVGTSDSIERHGNSTEFRTIYQFTINTTPYFMYYIYIVKNTFEPDTEGVRTIQIIKEEDDKKYFIYWQDMLPGVFNPEEDI